MNDKLDDLMRRNAPILHEVSNLELPHDSNWNGALALMSCFALAVLFFNLSMKPKVENALILEESLSWDLTSEEGFEEFEIFK